MGEEPNCVDTGHVRGRWCKIGSLEKYKMHMISMTGPVFYDSVWVEQGLDVWGEKKKIWINYLDELGRGAITGLLEITQGHNGG